MSCSNLPGTTFQVYLLDFLKIFSTCPHMCKKARTAGTDLHGTRTTMARALNARYCPNHEESDLAPQLPYVEFQNKSGLHHQPYVFRKFLSRVLGATQG